MTNVEKLDELRILAHVRKSLGADCDEDTSLDDTINNLSNSDLIAQWSQWHFGYKEWWETMKRLFDKLEEIDKTNG
jgi:hypothetical protein